MTWISIHRPSNVNSKSCADQKVSKPRFPSPKRYLAYSSRTWKVNKRPVNKIWIIYCSTAISYVVLFLCLLVIAVVVNGPQPAKILQLQRGITKSPMIYCQELHTVHWHNICDNNDLNLSQDLDDGDDYMNTADLNVYGNLWKKKKLLKRSKQTTNLIMLIMIICINHIWWLQFCYAWPLW